MRRVDWNFTTAEEALEELVEMIGLEGVVDGLVKEYGVDEIDSILFKLILEREEMDYQGNLIKEGWETN